MSLITIKGHNGKTVDVDPERVEGLEYDDDARLTRVFMFGGNWLSVVMPRQDVRKILDEAMATRRLVEETATVVKQSKENGVRLREMEQEVGKEKASAISRSGSNTPRLRSDPV